MRFHDLRHKNTQNIHGPLSLKNLKDFLKVIKHKTVIPYRVCIDKTREKAKENT